MKIAFIAAGAAGMYCGSCLRDNAVAAALLRAGHQVTLIPLYTPLRLDRDDVQSPHVFYGGINIYLQHRYAFFRRFRVFDGVMNSRPVLRLATRMAGMTNARELGELTISTMSGAAGPLRREVEKLGNYLADEINPEIVNLPNAMFVGAAGTLREMTGRPVVCSLTGEDLFLDELIQPYRTQARELLHRYARDVDAFIATSRYFADHMAAYMDVPRERIHVVPLGIDHAGFGRDGDRPTEPFTIGYLARIAPEKGFHLLCEAFALFKQKPGTESARLRVAGYLGAKDRVYFEAAAARMQASGLHPHFEYLGEVTHEQKLRFLDSLSVLSVPTIYREPKGLFLLEAWAHGVPVVQPAHGSFTEMIDATAGGLLFEPGNAQDLADKLYELMQNPEAADEHARRARETVRQIYTADAMADNTVAVYRAVLKKVEGIEAGHAG